MTFEFLIFYTTPLSGNARDIEGSFDNLVPKKASTIPMTMLKAGAIASFALFVCKCHLP
jgi:hypothetical protein